LSSQYRIVGVGRLLGEHVEAGAGDAALLEHSPTPLVDDRPRAVLIRYAVGFIRARLSALTR
jgi:hypothetical protein